MKRAGNLYQQCCTRESLHAAYLRASRGKHATRACFRFERSLGAQLEALYLELQNGTYRPRPYYSFEVLEPKRRRIYAPAFRDLVVQHAIYAVIGPIFDRTFIDQSFACRQGRGTHAAADYAQKALQQSPRNSCALKLDIRKFFYRIDHAILRRLIERKIKDRPMVDLMMMFASYGEPVGIPIGNLLSQVFALIYLNPLDHFIKRTLKIKRYARYVDDFVLFGISRAQALECKARIEQFLIGLKLEFSKWTLAPISRGLNFIGYRTWASRRFVRRRALYNFRHALKRGDAAAVVSLLAHANRTHSRNHMIRTLKERGYDRNCQLHKDCYA